LRSRDRFLLSEDDQEAVMKELLSELASADPLSSSEDAALRDIVRRMADAAEQSVMGGTTPTRAPWWKRRAMIPFVILGAVALTGAAAAVPLGLWINGTKVELDVEIPIAYTTDTGVEVNCRYGLYFGDPAHRTEGDERLAAFADGHDWTGIGQRIYDQAIANPFVPGPDDDWQVDSPELRDRMSFARATNLIWDEVPGDLRALGQGAGGTMDCEGRLH
jgi:hypothetical protein